MRQDVYHGRTSSSWLPGSNANEDSTVINHGFVHPDYMAAGLCEFQPALVYLLAGKPVPRASLFNLDAVYDEIVDLDFVVGNIPSGTTSTNRPPGGFIYMRDASSQPTGEIYYPYGNDWGARRRMHFATFDATVRAFGADGLASIPAAAWETQHSQVVDRSAVQWVRFQIDDQSGELHYGSHGRIFDLTATSPPWYYSPSLVVICAGDAVVSFSGSSAASYIGAYYTWIVNGTNFSPMPLLPRAGSTNYNYSDRWGDYSYTSVDPADDWSIWTVQECADGDRITPYAGPWATWISWIVRSP